MCVPAQALADIDHPSHASVPFTFHRRVSRDTRKFALSRTPLSHMSAPTLALTLHMGATAPAQATPAAPPVTSCSPPSRSCRRGSNHGQRGAPFFTHTKPVDHLSLAMELVDRHS
jgi:hypothetical protein